MISNFEVLTDKFSDLADLGFRAEDVMKSGYYRESTQLMRQFAEGILKNFLHEDSLSYAQMMKDPRFLKRVDSLTYDSFRRLKEIGNDSSHYKYPIDNQSTKHYYIRTKSDAINGLKYCHSVAKWYFEYYGEN